MQSKNLTSTRPFGPSADELRGGLDAKPVYTDYVLFMLFIKYVSDK